VPPEILTEVQPSNGAPPDEPPTPSTWWERYSAFGLRSLTEAARGVLDADSRAIVADCLPPPERSEAWPELRVRTGVVVGAVQSGKTASMLGIAALLLDAGTDVLVILAGTRVALWKQTYERLLRQLDGSSPDSAAERWDARVLVPQPTAMLRGDVRATPAGYMSAAGAKIEHALLARRPTVLVIPKVEQHLLAASRELHDRIDRVAGKLDRALHMVVMDDEADDASVLDANDSKTIPRRIEMLWTGKRRGQPAHPSLYATYVAYTATPQANFLQQSHNPLAPRSFCAALRAPYKAGVATGGRRSPTFAEPQGITRYYCGGELFYNELQDNRDAALCRPTRYPQREEAEDEHTHERRVRAAADSMLLDGLRAYLVACAVRTMQAQTEGKLTPSQIPEQLTTTDRKRLPPPCSMLIHPSARQDLHLGEARRLILLSSGRDPDDPANDVVDTSTLKLDVEALRASLVAPAWEAWPASYRATLRALSTWPGAGDLWLPGGGDWSQLASVISTEVLPYVRIRIINSDPASDDRPEFDPIERVDGSVAAPRDLLTVFISGNVMSRGITIEGLLTTVFTRPASEPAADTQMQMQRWFGYRGAHAHLCRVLAFDDQLRLFRTYHEHDVSMRTEILANMDRAELQTPNVVLQGPRSLATAKIPTTRLPLHPGATPSVKIIEADDLEAAQANATVLARALAAGAWIDIGPDDRPRGRLRTDPISLDDVASMLDELRYAAYGPGASEDVRFTRWRSLEDQLGLLAAERPLLRAPSVEGTAELDPRSCPYSIAAYLRLWAAALKRTRCDGLYPSDTEGTSWSLAQPLMHPPLFHVGIAYGEAGISRWPELEKLGVRTMKRGQASGSPRILNTLWGRRGEGGKFHGDQLFDYNFTKLVPPPLLSGEPVWRKRGHPGLILFHAIRDDGAPYDAVTVGLAIPHGGPEQFAALPAIDGRPR
jgi:hypothetical protein